MTVEENAPPAQLQAQAVGREAMERALTGASPPVPQRSMKLLPRPSWPVRSPRIVCISDCHFTAAVRDSNGTGNVVIGCNVLLCVDDVDERVRFRLHGLEVVEALARDSQNCGATQQPNLRVANAASPCGLPSYSAETEDMTALFGKCPLGTFDMLHAVSHSLTGRTVLMRRVSLSGAYKVQYLGQMTHFADELFHRPNMVRSARATVDIDVGRDGRSGGHHNLPSPSPIGRSRLITARPTPSWRGCAWLNSSSSKVTGAQRNSRRSAPDVIFSRESALTLSNIHMPITPNLPDPVMISLHPELEVPLRGGRRHCSTASSLARRADGTTAFARSCIPEESLRRVRERSESERARMFPYGSENAASATSSRHGIAAWFACPPRRDPNTGARPTQQRGSPIEHARLCERGRSSLGRAPRLVRGWCDPIGGWVIQCADRRRTRACPGTPRFAGRAHGALSATAEIAGIASVGSLSPYRELLGRGDREGVLCCRSREGSGYFLEGQGAMRVGRAAQLCDLGALPGSADDIESIARRNEDVMVGTQIAYRDRHATTNVLGYDSTLATPNRWIIVKKHPRERGGLRDWEDARNLRAYPRLFEVFGRHASARRTASFLMSDRTARTVGTVHEIISPVHESRVGSRNQIVPFEWAGQMIGIAAQAGQRLLSGRTHRDVRSGMLSNAVFSVRSLAEHTAKMSALVALRSRSRDSCPLPSTHHDRGEVRGELAERATVLSTSSCDSFACVQGARAVASVQNNSCNCIHCVLRSRAGWREDFPQGDAWQLRQEDTTPVGRGTHSRGPDSNCGLVSGVAASAHPAARKVDVGPIRESLGRPPSASSEERTWAGMTGRVRSRLKDRLDTEMEEREVRASNAHERGMLNAEQARGRRDLGDGETLTTCEPVHPRDIGAQVRVRRTGIRPVRQVTKNEQYPSQRPPRVCCGATPTTEFSGERAGGPWRALQAHPTQPDVLLQKKSWQSTPTRKLSELYRTPSASQHAARTSTIRATARRSPASSLKHAAASIEPPPSPTDAQGSPSPFFSRSALAYLARSHFAPRHAHLTSLRLTHITVHLLFALSGGASTGTSQPRDIYHRGYQDAPTAPGTLTRPRTAVAVPPGRRRGMQQTRGREAPARAVRIRRGGPGGCRGRGGKPAGAPRLLSVRRSRNAGAWHGDGGLELGGGDEERVGSAQCTSDRRAAVRVGGGGRWCGGALYYYRRAFVMRVRGAGELALCQSAFVRQGRGGGLGREDSAGWYSGHLWQSRNQRPGNVWAAAGLPRRGDRCEGDLEEEEGAKEGGGRRTLRTPSLWPGKASRGQGPGGNSSCGVGASHSRARSSLGFRQSTTPSGSVLPDRGSGSPPPSSFGDSAQHAGGERAALCSSVRDSARPGAVCRTRARVPANIIRASFLALHVPSPAARARARGTSPYTHRATAQRTSKPGTVVAHRRACASEWQNVPERERSRTVCALRDALRGNVDDAKVGVRRARDHSGVGRLLLPRPSSLAIVGTPRPARHRHQCARRRAVQCRRSLPDVDVCTSVGPVAASRNHRAAQLAILDRAKDIFGCSPNPPFQIPFWLTLTLLLLANKRRDLLGEKHDVL
ncbi:hypothetical protein BC628DRAFT_1340555 [Trametes gibbosa]|nr:hypothetical protein BC628DRAFT_1340555 [Trametes gibbosa]